MTQKVLIAYGDGPGREAVSAAERVIRTAAPDIELCRGLIGSDAYSNTSYALPPETLELVSECDAMVVGHVDMTEINERDPLETIRLQTGLSIEYSEFFPLCQYIGNGSISASVVSPSPDNRLNIRETESLEGVSSEVFTSVDLAENLMDTALHLAELKRAKEVRFVSDDLLFPVRDKLIKGKFRRLFAASEFPTKECSPADISYLLAHDASALDFVVCGSDTATCMNGGAAGTAGGGGLMPHAFIGNGFSMYLQSPLLEGDPSERVSNPTSIILSAAVMLLFMGRNDSYRMIRDAVCEMYRTGNTTPDIGGHLSAETFADGVVRLVRSDILTQ